MLPMLPQMPLEASAQRFPRTLDLTAGMPAGEPTAAGFAEALGASLATIAAAPGADTGADVLPPPGQQQGGNILPKGPLPGKDLPLRAAPDDRAATLLASGSIAGAAVAAEAPPSIAAVAPPALPGLDGASPSESPLAKPKRPPQACATGKTAPEATELAASEVAAMLPLAEAGAAMVPTPANPAAPHAATAPSEAAILPVIDTAPPPPLPIESAAPALPAPVGLAGPVAAPAQAAAVLPLAEGQASFASLSSQSGQAPLSGGLAPAKAKSGAAPALPAEPLSPVPPALAIPSSAAASATVLVSSPATVSEAGAAQGAMPASAAASAPDLAAAIDQLGTYREAARSIRPELTLRHSEFGAVHLRLEAAAGANAAGAGEWRALLTSRDPGFVPAVQAALAERAIAASSESTGHHSAHSGGRSSEGAAGQGQNSGQSPYGSSPGSGQGSSQPYFAQTSTEGRKVAATGKEAADNASPPAGAPGGGLFA